MTYLDKRHKLRLSVSDKEGLRNLRKRRRALGLMQRQFADIVGVTQPYVSMIESGNCPMPAAWRVLLRADVAKSAPKASRKAVGSRG
ncbi:MAG: helix-turn-helix domain-containing protein [Dehalococcoidia bacterium]|nr:helix-turn-helix domain-containing protein [Dehalococcoidia bacterium]